MAEQTWLVTGGAGFIGSNVVRTLAQRGKHPVVLDNLSRPSAPLNLSWLRDELGPDGFAFVEADVCDVAALAEAFREHGPFDVVLHLAGQVAVTTSVADPRADLETNVLGSFNVLEATRLHAPEAAFINVSTNKVYGQLEHHRIEEQPTRYSDLDAPEGVSERQPLDPHSPYGCSKAAADVYTLDYARIYGLKTLSLRQSCIYGPRQFGIEDQGWVAWFAIATRLGMPLTLYGNGKQVRDLLHVDDLVELYLAAAERAADCAGRAYNIGGGPANSLSLLELLERLGAWRGEPVRPALAEPRPGDQLVFVADSSRAAADFGWRPTVGIEAGLSDLLGWIEEHAAEVGEILRTA
jgi:CDP-paratose 2-epimerase